MESADVVVGVDSDVVDVVVGVESTDAVAVGVANVVTVWVESAGSDVAEALSSSIVYWESDKQSKYNVC